MTPLTAGFLTRFRIPHINGVALAECTTKQVETEVFRLRDDKEKTDAEWDAYFALTYELRKRNQSLYSYNYNQYPPSMLIDGGY